VSPGTITRLGLMAATALLASAQMTTGAIEASVHDPSGAPVVHATLLLKAPGASGSARIAVTGIDGVYSFKDLAPGTYTLIVAAEGFNPYTKEKIVVEPQRTVTSLAQLSLDPQFKIIRSERTELEIPQCDLFPNGLVFVFENGKMTPKIGGVHRP
jgi:hypothetical protein